MKKIISLILALTMIFALAMTASAVSIEITAPAGNGDKSGLTYTAYKVFSASVSEDGNKASYTIKEDGPFWDVVNTRGNFNLAKVPGSTDEYVVTTTLDEALILNQLKLSADKGTGIDATYANGKFTIENVDEGYYYIESSFGTGIILDTFGKSTIPVEPKNDLPTIEKKIIAVGNNTGISVEEAIASIGQSITFQLIVKIPATTPVNSKIYIYDTIDAGLTPGDANPFMQGHTYITSDYHSGWGGGTSGQPIGTITVNQDMINNAENGFFTVTGQYTANLNGDAVIGEAGNKNKAKLVYDPSTGEANYTTQEEEVVVYTGEVKVYKHTGTGDSKQPLPGAGFVVKTTHGTTHYYKNESGRVTWVTDINQATEYFSGSAGNLVDKDGNDVSFMGLVFGQVYALEEKTVPAGYNKAEDKFFKITDKGVTVEADGTTPIAESTIEVENKSGAVLPSTGGMGTTLFYILGSLMAVGALVVLVTNKRVRV